jgi:ribosomal protein S18 acetylase RimI-like enzyme
MQISFAEKNDAPEIAKIHKEEINKGFLSFLGIPILRLFYQTIIVYKGGFCFLVKENGNILGFVAGCVDLKDFNKYFLKKNIFFITLIMISKIFNPFVRKKIKENFLHIKREDGLPKAELLSIAVRKDFHGRKLGSMLVARFVEEMKKRGVKNFKVLVGKELNLFGFYTKNGFELVPEYNNSESTSSIFTYTIN